MVREKKGTIGGDGRERDFHQMIVRSPRKQKRSERDRCAAKNAAQQQPGGGKNPAQVIPIEVRCCPEATAIATPKATAAVPSLSRLSVSIRTPNRPRTLASLNVAMTETGSVAAMRAPNTSAPSHCQRAR